MPSISPSEPVKSGGIHIGDVGGSVNFSALGDIVGGDKITTITTTIQISVEAITQRPLVTTSPYRGLDRFEDRDKDLFFGRDQLIKSLLAELGASNVLLVLGASGSGKSSVVRAGLLPALSQLIGARFRYFTFVPDVNPFESLRSALQGAGFSQAQTRELLDAHPETPAKLIHTLQREGDQWLFFIDQFEEIFTVSDQTLRKTFIAALVAMAQDTASSTKLVLAMRADFLDRFSPFPQFAKIIEKNIDFVADMHPDELRLAIEQPAARHGVVFEQGLVEEIIKDVQGQAGSLPLLQYTLDLLWQEESREGGLADRHLNTRAYRKLGGVRGALQKRANEIYASFGEGSDAKAAAPKQEIVRQIFLRLVDLAGEGSNDAAWRPVRRRAPMSIFATAQEQEILRALIDQKLLVSNREGDDATVEVAHEALFTSWGWLKNWIEAGKQVIFARNRLADDARRWQRRQQDDVSGAEEELLSGTRLAQALDMRARGDFAAVVGGLGEAETQFLDASAALRDRRAQEEQARHQRELERARELEQALTRANKELAVSESQRLAFASRFLNASAPETALLLACEAVQWDRNPLCEDVLRDALDNVTWQVRGFAGHLKAVNSAMFSRDGQRIVTASDDATARLWDVNGNCVVVYRGHKERVTSAVFSPDEKQVLTSSVDGTVCLWRSDGHLVMTLTYPRGKYASNWDMWCSFSPDGQHMLVCNESTASLWDTDGRLCTTNWDARSQLDVYTEAFLQDPSRDDDPYARAESEGHIGRIYSAVFSPDGQRILTASEDKTARIWNLSGQQLVILRGHKDQVINAIFSPSDGRLILTGSNDKTARLWNADGELLAILEGHTADVRHLAFSPDGQLMLTAVDGGGVHDVVVRLWGRSGKLLATLEGHSDSGWIKQLAFSPDGQRILTGSSDKTARLWDLEGRALAVFRGHLGTIWSATFSPTGQSILTGSEDGTVRLWESTQSLLPTLAGHTEAVASGVYSADGTHILTSSTARATGLWDTAGQRRADYIGNANLLTDDILSPDGRYLLTMEHENRQVHLWQLPPDLRWFDSWASEDRNKSTANHITQLGVQSDTGPDQLNAPLVTFTISEDATKGYFRIEKAVFNADGMRILTLANERAQLWGQQGELVAMLNGPNLNPREKLTVDFAMFSPDGQRVLGGSINGTAWLWTKEGQLITSFLIDDKSARDNLFSITFSPDGQRILTTIRRSADLWDLNGRHLVSLPCQTNKVKRGLFSPKGDRILTVAEAALPDVRLWDCDGNLITSLEVIGGENAPVLFDREGKRFCIVDNNIIKIWHRDGALLATLVTDREAWIKHVAFSPDGEHLLTASTDGTAQLWVIREEGRLQSTFKGHRVEVNSVVFSPDGRRVLTASSDGTARQFLVHVDDLLAAAARRVGRQLDAEEITRFNIQTPLRFDPKAFRVPKKLNLRATPTTRPCTDRGIKNPLETRS